MVLLIICILTCEHSNQQADLVVHHSPGDTITKDPNVYLFISGGYDSIFRLCQLVLVDKMSVQPIYINIKETDGYSNTTGYSVRRRNVRYEISSIHAAISKLTHMGYGHLIHPVQTITSCKLSEPVLRAGRQFARDGKFARPITQYIYMAQISLIMKKKIETGVLCSDGGAMWKTIGNIIDPRTKMIDMKKITTPQSFELIFRNMRFPLCGTSKKEMLQIAINHRFDDILHGTISCWSPDKNGNPCKKCNMCKERII